MSKTGKRGRDAINGQIVSLAETRRRPNSTVVEAFKKDKNGRPVN